MKLAKGLVIIVLLGFVACATPRSMQQGISVTEPVVGYTNVTVWSSRPAPVITAENAPEAYLESESSFYGGLDWGAIGIAATAFLEPWVSIPLAAVEATERIIQGVTVTEYTVVSMTAPADSVGDVVLQRDTEGRALVTIGSQQVAAAQAIYED